MVAGAPDSWDQSISISSGQVSHYTNSTWSPCGQFVAALTKGAVEIRDPLSSELLSTLTKSDTQLICGLAYSPDGRSLACLSNTALVIWDIQTGGVAREIGHGSVSDNSSLVWSLDGRMVGTVEGQETSTVHIYDITLGTTWSPGTLQSHHEPHLWAHNTSFQAVTMRWDCQDLTIDIFMVGSILTKTESFHIKLSEQYFQIGSFSPTTYRVSISVNGCLVVLDIRSLQYLLEQVQSFSSQCFSSDGSFFAASSLSGTHIWRYTSGSYTPWRELQTQDLTIFYESSLLFSPTLSSILYCFTGIIRVWHFDSPPTRAHSNNHTLLAVLSCCGTYIATSHWGGSTVTITNLHLQTASQFIDAGVKIDSLALTGNVLLVTSSNELGYEEVTAWLLTENGVVDGVFANRRAGHGDSIWNVSGNVTSGFLIGDQVATIEIGSTTHIYHTRTGEVLESARAPPRSHSQDYPPWRVRYGHHYPNYCRVGKQSTPSEGGWLVSQDTLREGWVKDPEGMHRLWIPVEWRTPSMDPGWFHNITTLWLNLRRNLREAAIIMF